MRRFMIPVIAIGLAGVPAAVEAQTAPRPERAHVGARAGGHGGPAERVLRQREALGLSAAQVTELERIRSEFAARNAPLLEQLRAARPAGAQLTEEQRVELRQRRAERAGRGRQLTEEQRAEMRQRREEMARMTPEQRAEMRQQMRERMQQTTPEQRQQMRERMRGMRQGGASEEARARMEALRPVMEQLRQNHAQARERVRAVLTAEQNAQLEARLQRRPGEPRGDGARRGEGARWGAGARQ